MTRCPKCGSKMEAGFVLEVDGGSAKPARWVEGMPERSFWTGIRLKGRAQIPITAMRCVRCGFLEQYARRPE
ncbi:MAG TPA: PF20097 family protein [Longimicrobiaceae bacterium]|nr:PF20097 family protein [Longimicrobiaceae bacterium]